MLVVALRNRELVEENLRQAGVKKELELAGEMQAMLLPKVWPNDSKIDVSGYYQPHQQIGGRLLRLLFSARRKSGHVYGRC